jgi:hypothetical protein
MIKEKTAVKLLVFLTLISAPSAELYAQAQILGSWTEGTSHTAEAGSRRVLLFIAHAEDQDTDMDITSVTYGGQPMTKIIEQNHGTIFRSYVGAFVLDEEGISAASGNTFDVTWAQVPFATPGYSSVFLGDVIQSTPVGASDGNGASSGYTLTTNPLSANNGDIVIVAGTNGNSGTYSVDNGFTEAIEVAVSSGDGVAGYKQATGVNETPSITHSSDSRQVIIGFVIRSGEGDPPTPDPAFFASAPAAVSDTEITMTATVGTDATGPVEYYFANITDPNHDSGWVTDPIYNDTGLNQNTRYTYTVRMRDAFFNTGDASTPPLSATTKRTPNLIVTIGGDYTNIQAAINDCNDGWIVEVDDGFWGGTGNRDIDFGGKAITLRSANGPQNCTINCGGGPTTPHRGFYFHSGEDANSIVEGFTITNGYVKYNVAIPGMDDRSGGAIYCTESEGLLPSSPTIRNCIITDNQVYDPDGWGYGGAISSVASAPIIIDCVISSNSAYYGGGISCDNSNYLEGPVHELKIINCTIKDNIAVCTDPVSGSDNGWGGGIYCLDNSVTIDNCTIIGNSAAWGGGIGFDSLGTLTPGARLKVIRSTISNNSASYANPAPYDWTYATGGGIGMLPFCGGIISESTITGNHALHYGGGIDCYYTTSLDIVNCIISGNLADSGNPDIPSAGGAICCFGSSPNIVNCTISSNEAEDYGAQAFDNFGGGGAIFCEDDWPYYSRPTIKNCVFENNGNHAIHEYGNEGDPNLTHCLFYNNTDGDYYDWDSGITVTGAENINAIDDGRTTYNKDGDPLFIMDDPTDPNAISWYWTDDPVLLPGNRTILYDSSGGFGVGELVGRHINASVSFGGVPMQRRQAYITANTATTIEVVGDLTGYAEKFHLYKVSDYHIQKGSPCVDTGTIFGAPRIDIEQNPRPVNITNTSEVTVIDLNNDSIADELDLMFFVNNWLRNDCLEPDSCDGCDLAPAGGDGVIDYLDFAVITSHWLMESLGDIGAYELQTAD